MESFAAVIRTILTRIRILQVSPSMSPPPTVTIDVDLRGPGLYRVEPTAWGAPEEETPQAVHSFLADPSANGRTVEAAARRDFRSAGRNERARTALADVTAFPTPRGLLSCQPPQVS